MKVIILAAGEGRRLRPLTDEKPKALLEVGGKPLVVRIVEALAAAGLTELIMNLHHRGEMIEAALGGGERYGVCISYSRESELLETGGGIFNALSLSGIEPGPEPFAVVNADLFTDFGFDRLRAALSPGKLGHLIMVDNPAHRSTGDFSLGEDGLLSSSGDRLTYAGISVLSPRLFEDVPGGRFALRELLIPAVEAGLLTGEHFRGRWIDVGTVDRYEQAVRLAHPNAGARFDRMPHSGNQ